MASEAIDDGNVLISNGGKVIAVFVCGFAAAAAFTNIAERLGVAPGAIIDGVMAFVTVVLVMTGWAARTNVAGEFYVAAGQLTPAVNALSSLAGWLALPAFAALAGLMFKYGFDALPFVVGPVAGLFFAAVLISPYLAASKATTVAEFLGLRFGRAVRVMAAIIIALASLTVFIAALSAAAGLTAQTVGIDAQAALGLALAFVLFVLLVGGFNSLTWTGTAVALIILISLAATAGVMTMHNFGHPLPPIGAAQALRSISELEISLIEKGVADAAQMKPHARAFLQIDQANFLGLIFSLAAATAALPHLLQRSLALPSSKAARTSSAWLMGLTVFVLLSASSAAIFGKFEILSLLDRGTTFKALPDWTGRLGNGDGLRIHGLSMQLSREVRSAVDAGAATPADVAKRLGATSPSSATQWAALKEPVKALLIETSKAAPAGRPWRDEWALFREKLLPAAAIAAGNKSGLVTLQALEVDGEALMQDLPEVMAVPATAAGLMKAGTLFGLLAIAGAGLFNAAAVLSRDLFAAGSARAITPAQVNGARVLIVLLGFAGGSAIISLRADWQSMTAIVLSAAAAALLPALILGIWWKRASAAGTVLGMVAGFAVALAYGLGTRYFPVALFDTLPAFSDAGAAAINRFTTLKTALASADGDRAVPIANALDTLARGSAFAPGLANWLGLGGASSLVFALPLAFLVMIVASIGSPRPRQEQIEFVDMIRQPPGAK